MVLGVVVISGAVGIALQWIQESIPAVGGLGRTDGRQWVLGMGELDELWVPLNPNPAVIL